LEIIMDKEELFYDMVLIGTSPLSLLEASSQLNLNKKVL